MHDDTPTDESTDESTEGDVDHESAGGDDHLRGADEPGADEPGPDETWSGTSRGHHLGDEGPARWSSGAYREEPSSERYQSLPPPEPPVGVATEPSRRLYRDPSGPIAGVATGVARFFGVDPLLVQVLFVLFALLGGAGIGIYVALWLVLPTVGPNDTLVRPEKWQTIAGAIILALMLFSATFAIGISFAGRVAILMIVIGVILLSQRPGAAADLSAQVRDTFAPPPVRNPAGSVLSPDAYAHQRNFGDRDAVPPASRPAQAFSSNPQVVFEPVGSAPRSGQPRPATVSTASGQTPYAWATPRTEPAPNFVVRRQATPPGPPITALTIAVAVFAAGVMLLLGTVLPISAGATWGIFALVCGGGLVASAFAGRGAWLLLVPASIALIGMGASIGVSELSLSDYSRSVGQVNIKVSVADDLGDEYSVGLGAIKLDLVDLTLADDESFEISVGVGDATVVVPEGMNVVLRGDVGQGEVMWLGEEISSEHDDLERRRIVRGETAPTLTIIADVGVGQLTVKNG